jgi:catechol 2,3-dioxygenase-like lactoylglutathione lyase family enzyme
MRSSLRDLQPAHQGLRSHHPVAWRRGPRAVQAVRMLDHLSIQCADVAASAAFYDAVLAPLGGVRVMDFGDVIGFGVPPNPDFWIGPRATGDGFRESHIAFVASNRAAVRAFFDAAVTAGAEVLHEPRLWPEYHPSYYGAFVRDPDGNNIEAVCHTPE